MRPPAFQKPQLATLVDHVPDGRHWLHEMKYDGYRCLVAVGDGQARIYTRSGLDWSDKFPDIVREAAALPAASALIDGEIVYMDKHGSPSFSGLQAALKKGGGGLVLCAFDLLALEEEDMKRLPNIERKERLRELLGAGGKTIRFAEHVVGAGEKLFKAMCAAKQEGIISKRADAHYAGRRTRNWLKIKCTRRQEFVIVGWSESAKGRGFASLLLAVHDKGRLRYAGRVGTGFSGETIRALSEELAAIERKAAPVEVPRAMRRGAHWVEPKLVAEIAFAEFTADGQVRHASFLGLRPEKPAEEVEVEEPQPIDPPGSSVVISNPDRVIFPSAEITKGELADYYDRIAPLMLKVTANRPISLVRCPQGRARHCFFQKHDAGSFGEHVRQVTIEENDGDRADYLYVVDRDGILACVQMGTIEFHGWGAPVGDFEHPDRLVFDLDPDESVDFADVKRAARDIQRHLADMGLASFPMLTGGKGVHVIAPLDRSAGWPEVKDFARRFAHALAEAEPERFTAALAKARRKGRIFIDWLRNQRGATAIMPYSARARAGAPVAAPVSWDELDDLDTASAFSVEDAERLIKRAETRALARWGEARQSLPAL